MNDKTQGEDGMPNIHGSILDGIRQVWFPAEFRIAAPGLPLDMLEIVDAEAQAAPYAQATDGGAGINDSIVSNKLAAEFATCLWYLKTKHFKREWDDDETGDDDPRVRRALGRLNKSIEALGESGIEVHDPTNKRYPAGGEGMMRPIQLVPTAGITFEVVTETVAPIIYRDDRLIQRGEVFVAVPKEDSVAATGFDTASPPAAKAPSQEHDPTDSSAPAASSAEAPSAQHESRDVHGDTSLDVDGAVGNATAQTDDAPQRDHMARGSEAKQAPVTSEAESTSVPEATEEPQQEQHDGDSTKSCN
ncbi:MAG: hypothetical protein JJU36_06750 [Phycisphaeraceae bacterium]|nr:hypothetical protein [Phycisphaeraceae bacterium]